MIHSSCAKLKKKISRGGEDSLTALETKDAKFFNLLGGVVKPKVSNAKMSKQIENIRRIEIAVLRAKQASGEKLTGPDHQFMREMILIESEKKTLAETREKVSEMTAKTLQIEKAASIQKLIELRDTCKRGDVVLNAAQELIALADAEAPPPEPFKLVPANPRNEKVTPIAGIA